ncbi:NAD(P)-dependent oxidoreductase [Celeribacter arenosi]|uniref:NAD(P)-dependent oxidoreductase n=2 Tax=Celeribacter arenosi TaxID=792649 RepID=A0ABP7JZ20_9RHOB
MVWVVRRPDAEFDDTLVWPDLSDPAPLLEHVAKFGAFDVVFGFAGVSQNSDKSDPTAMAQHVSLARNTVLAAKVAGIPRVLLASSSAVYGAGKGVPFREDDPLTPVNAYGASKRDMEHAVSGEDGVTCLRVGNVAGADMLLTNALASDGAPLTLDIFPDGHGPRRSYIGPNNLARVLVGLASVPSPLPKLLNVAAPNPVAMDSILDAAGIKWTSRPKSASGHQDIVLDCARIAQVVPSEISEVTAEGIVADWQRTIGAL